MPCLDRPRNIAFMKRRGAQLALDGNAASARLGRSVAVSRPDRSIVAAWAERTVCATCLAGYRWSRVDGSGRDLRTLEGEPEPLSIFSRAS
jgi:hypothetical protein